MDPCLLVLLCLIPGLVLGQTDPCPSGLQLCFTEFNNAKTAAGTNLEQECSAALNVTLCLGLLKPLCSSSGQRNVDSALSGIQHDYAGPPKNCSLDTAGMVVSVNTCDGLFRVCGTARADPQDQCSTVPSHQACLQSVLGSCDPAMNSTGQNYIQELKNSLVPFNCRFDAVLTTARTELSGQDCGTVFTACHSGYGDENDICSVLPQYEYCAENVVATTCDRQSYLQILAFIAQTQSDNNCLLSETTVWTEYSSSSPAVQSTEPTALRTSDSAPTQGITSSASSTSRAAEEGTTKPATSVASATEERTSKVTSETAPSSLGWDSSPTSSTEVVKSTAHASSSSLVSSTLREVESTSSDQSVTSTDRVSNTETQVSSVKQSSDFSSQRPQHSSSQSPLESSTPESSTSTKLPSPSPSLAQEFVTTTSSSRSPEPITYYYSGATRTGSTTAAGRVGLGSVVLLSLLL